MKRKAAGAGRQKSLLEFKAALANRPQQRGDTKQSNLDGADDAVGVTEKPPLVTHVSSNGDSDSPAVKKDRQKPTPVSISSTSEEADDNGRSAIQTPKKRRVISSDSSDDDVIVVNSRKPLSAVSKTQNTVTLSNSSSDSDLPVLPFKSSNTQSSVLESSEDDAPILSSVRKRKTFDSSAPTSSVPQRRKVVRRLASLSDEDDTVVQEQPSADEQSGEELARQELESDEEYLRDSKITNNRLRTKALSSAQKKKSKFLEQIRNKRKGEVLEVSDDEKPTEALYDTEKRSRLQKRRSLVVSEDEDEEASAATLSENSSRQSPDAGALPGSDDALDDGTAVYEDQDMDDEDFIVDDENDLLGAPDLEAVNQDTEDMLDRYRSMKKKLKDCFKDVIEWLVLEICSSDHNLLFEKRSSFRFQNGFAKIDSHIQGYRKSSFTSPAWTSSFLEALRSRPQMDSGNEEVQDTVSCGACGRKQHVYLRAVFLRGKGYDPSIKALFETLDEEEDEEEEEEEERFEADLFYLGSECFKKATIHHRLTHWVNELSIKVRSRVYQESAFLPKSGDGEPDPDIANVIFEKMSHGRVVDGLYKDFKLFLDEVETLSKLSNT